MKLFKINYKYFSGEAESSIIFAESEKDALSFVKDESKQKIENMEKYWEFGVSSKTTLLVNPLIFCIIDYEY